MGGGLPHSSSDLSMEPVFRESPESWQQNRQQALQLGVEADRCSHQCTAFMDGAGLISIEEVLSSIINEISIYISVLPLRCFLKFWVQMMEFLHMGIINVTCQTGINLSVSCASSLLPV